VHQTEILEQLDAAAVEFMFPDLDHGHYYAVDAQLHGYHDAERWALIVEAIGYSPRAGNLVDVLHVFGNRLTDGEPGFDNGTLPRTSAAAVARTRSRASRANRLRSSGSGEPSEGRPNRREWRRTPLRAARRRRTSQRPAPRHPGRPAPAERCHVNDTFQQRHSAGDQRRFLLLGEPPRGHVRGSGTYDPSRSGPRLKRLEAWADSEDRLPPCFDETSQRVERP
jgi:hypothetical protein